MGHLFVEAQRELESERERENEAQHREVRGSDCSDGPAGALHTACACNAPALAAVFVRIECRSVTSAQR